VRELRNAVERAMIFEDGALISAGHLAIGPEPRAAAGERAADKALSLPEAERELIARAMESTRGNVSKAALVLGISRDTLRYKLKKMKDDGAP
jgi:two-component system response regulator AtoC